jgi:hypothetical protein
MLNVNFHAWTWTSTCCMSKFISMLHVQVMSMLRVRPCCMFVHAACSGLFSMDTWTWIFSIGMDMYMQHGHDPAAWKNTIFLSMFRSMLYVHDHIHATCTSTRCLSTYMLRAHAHAVNPCSYFMSLLCPCCMFNSMQHGHRHAGGTWACSIDMCI